MELKVGVYLSKMQTKITLHKVSYNEVTYTVGERTIKQHIPYKAMKEYLEFYECKYVPFQYEEWD